MAKSKDLDLTDAANRLTADKGKHSSGTGMHPMGDRNRVPANDNPIRTDSGDNSPHARLK
jgi:hypothetical protein